MADNDDEALDELLNEQIHEEKPEGFVENHEDMPQKHFRWLIIGPTGCGKTTELFKYLMQGNKLLYDKIYIYARDLGEAKYRHLMNHFSELALMNGMSPDDLLVVGDQPEDIIPVSDLDRSRQNLMIFDDFIADAKTNATVIREHFIRGRKMNCSYIYLTQSFTPTNKDIRKNCDWLTLYGGLTMGDVDTVYRNINTQGLSLHRFRDLYKAATKVRHDNLRLKR